MITEPTPAAGRQSCADMLKQVVDAAVSLQEAARSYVVRSIEELIEVKSAGYRAEAVMLEYCCRITERDLRLKLMLAGMEEFETSVVDSKKTSLVGAIRFVQTKAWLYYKSLEDPRAALQNILDYTDDATKMLDNSHRDQEQVILEGLRSLDNDLLKYQRAVITNKF